MVHFDDAGNLTDQTINKLIKSGKSHLLSLVLSDLEVKIVL